MPCVERIRLHQRVTGQDVGDWSLRALIRGTDIALTDRQGAWFKELICRSTMWAIKMERVGISGIQWAKGGAEGESAVYSSS